MAEGAPRKRLRLVSADEESPIPDLSAQADSPVTETWIDVIDGFLSQLALQENVDHKGLWEPPCRSGTYGFYKSRLRTFARWVEDTGLSIAQFRGRHLTQFVTWHRMQVVQARLGPRKVSPTTLRHDAVAVRALMRYARQEEYILTFPFSDYELPKGEKNRGIHATEKDVFLLLASLRQRWDPEKNPAIKNMHASRRRFCRTRMHAIIAGLADTGCRINEFLLLEFGDLNRETMEVTLQAENTKSGKGRIVPISENWLSVLDEWLRARPKCETGLIFVGEYGDRVTTNTWGRSFREHILWAKAQPAFAELQYLTPHSLRHYAGTEIYKQAPAAAQAILGHASPSTTQIYNHSDKEREFLRAQHRAASPLARAQQERPIVVNKRTEERKRKRLT